MIEAHYNLGNAAFLAGDFASAKRRLCGTCNRSRTNGPPSSCSATPFDFQRARRARGCFEQALKQNPAAPGAHNGLANILRNQGRHDDALRHYRLAIQYDAKQ